MNESRGLSERLWFGIISLFFLVNITVINNHARLYIVTCEARHHLQLYEQPAISCGQMLLLTFWKRSVKECLIANW